MVRQSPVVYPDETGWKIGGNNQWLWTFVAKDATIYTIRPSRGHEVAEEILGADWNGTMVHDGWSPYDFFDKARHQQCLGHLLRRGRDLVHKAIGRAGEFPEKVKSTHVYGTRQPLKSELSHLRSWTKSTGLINPEPQRKYHNYYIVKGVGGSTLRFQAESHRFHPRAFKIKTLYGVGNDWPIKYDDLAPYYEKAEKILGVAGLEKDPLISEPILERAQQPPKELVLFEERFGQKALDFGFAAPKGICGAEVSCS